MENKRNNGGKYILETSSRQMKMKPKKTETKYNRKTTKIEINKKVKYKRKTQGRQREG